MIDPRLISKYDVPVPRYTSYPTVPNWQPAAPTEETWFRATDDKLRRNTATSLYLHLPFCEQLCTYCGCNKRITKNHDVEAPYIQALLGEWELYRRHLEEVPLINEIHLGGGTPTFFSPESLDRLLSGLRKYGQWSGQLAGSLEVHPSSTTEAHLRVLYNHGFRRISIGVQDFSQRILQIINRRQTTEQVYENVALARAVGYQSINFDLIFGLPTQTPQDIARTMDEVAQLLPDRIALYSYAHVPWKQPSQRAYSEVDLPRGAEKRRLYDLARGQLLALGYTDIGMDHFALYTDDLYTAKASGSMHRNFMGFTDRYTEVNIGLGASAIGDVGNVYVQNEKRVESYQEAIYSGQLPIVKGHQLNELEQLIRRHILNLMCRDATTWTAQELRLLPHLADPTHWADLISDGLIRHSRSGLAVTRSGQAFIRNICARLDLYYTGTVSNTPVYSQAV